MGDRWKDIHNLPWSSWRETAMDEGLLFVEVINQLVQNDYIQNAGLKAAAKSNLAVLPVIQAFKSNDEFLERLAGDALGLIMAIWRSYDKELDPKYWPSHSMKETIDELAGIIQILQSLAKRKADKNRIKRAISALLTSEIKYCRRKMDAAAAKLEAELGININSLLLEVVHEREGWYRQRSQSGKKSVSEYSANAAKREVEQMLEEERKKYVEDEWRNFTVLMQAR